MERQAISPNNFYEKTDFIPPALRPGPGREGALRAARQDPNRRLRTFPSQHEAFSYCDARPGQGLRIWAMEVDTNGRRLFTAASYFAFWRFYARLLRRNMPMHYYEVIRERNASRLYFDLEYQKEFNPNIDGEQMVNALIDTVRELSGENVRCENFVQLDSTTDKKFSRHLIFPTIAFHDNAQVGNFAKRVVDTICAKDEKLMNVYKSDHEFVPFVDLSVYSRNRCFRLAGSSKYGRTAALHPVNGNGEISKKGISKDLFMLSLVCAIDSNIRLRGSVMPLERNILSGSSYTNGYESSTGSGYDRNRRTSSFPRLDEYIMQIVRPRKGDIYGVTIVATNETVIYAIKGGYKYCANIGRHHKSNNVLLVAETKEGRMYQRCFDPDCKGFRSDAWDIPKWVFGVENESNFVDDKIDEDELSMMMQYWEEGLDTDGGVNDDVMNDIMDSYLLDSDQTD